MNAFILDVCVVIILSFFAIVGFRKGILKSFLSLVGSLFAVILAVYFSDIISKAIYFNCISPQIEEEVRKISDTSLLNADVLLSKLPFSFFGFLPRFGITTEEINHIINSNTVEVLPSKISEILYPVIANILKSIFVIALFVIFIFAMKFLSKFLLKLFKTQFLNGANSILGGVFGVFKGYVIIVAAMCFLKVFASMDTQVPEIFTANTISSTTIFKIIYDNNPVYGLFKTI
ncbi:MAG: CvpA family protein [Clostridia bacterium]|nr:CvpA family protein [Clostridia bacterium]